ncbi:methionyl-tRNA formyltransferase [bacterium]|nr:MAG: methionyl-tRNA formyltransferase [bacterium]
MRLVYFGTGTFALPALRALAPHIVLVVTQPDRPTGRGMKMQPAPAKLVAQELGLPVQSPEKTRAPEFVARLRELDADSLVVASYGQILSTAVLESARRGGINLHGSILPEYRGAAPIQCCILEGRTETGITLMQMDRGMDTGDMIEIVRTPIGPDETYGELQDRLAIIAADLAVGWMPKIVAGDYPRVPQDSDRATIAPKIEKSEAEIIFSKPAYQEYNRFRAFTPAPGPFIRTTQGFLRLHTVRLAEGKAEPGTILAVSPEPVVAFGEGALRLVEVQPEGKRRMSGRDWANGARLRVGDRL